MFGIGGFELFIILLFGFLIFGPDKLPEIARMVGVAVSKFNKAQEEVNAVIKNEVLDPYKDAGTTAEKTASGDLSSKPVPKADVQGETFAQRKARYDRERAERKKQQEIEANRAEMKQKAAEAAREASKAEEAKTDQAAANEAPANQASVSEAPAQANLGKLEAEAISSSPSKPVPSAKATLTAEELYGNKPLRPKKKAKAEESQAAAPVAAALPDENEPADKEVDRFVSSFTDEPVSKTEGGE